jgi:hypothetical protein
VWTSPPSRALPVRLLQRNCSLCGCARPTPGCKEIVSEYISDSSAIPKYNSDSSYGFDFGSNPIKSESELNTTEELLSGPAAGLFTTSAHTNRFVY